ncbi:hypothetical protein [Epilithonimonas mollis]|uniref:Uncharacterized protein n=1 Tax=Epilithonimonas mollis TaxID=216903 RepID=A0A1M6NXN6_9FLAO|nr:hypothetical protein [Epilithonimonas mollis]SHK00394.1 hypothetical protein SAMN05444371_0724 [Epilithonimonas mollis]
MKKYFFLLIMIFASIFTNAQTENLIKNNNDFYLGDIDKKTKIKVVFDSVSLQNNSLETYNVKGYSDVEGTKANFSGTITLNIERTKNSPKGNLKIYNFKFSEEGTGKHSGTFSGDMLSLSLGKLAVIGFEGNWENYEKSLKFPVYFDNSNKIYNLKK